MLGIGCALSPWSLTDEGARLSTASEASCSSSVNSESSESGSNCVGFDGWGGGVGEGEGELRESSERVELAIWNDERKGRSVDYEQTKGGVREK